MYNNAIINEINLAEPQSLFKTSMKPFLKWAGGKSQLISELEKYIPLSFNKYIEPFVGGGAFYFFLNPSLPIISDLNEELIITYEIVKKTSKNSYYFCKHLRMKKNIITTLDLKIPKISLMLNVLQE